LTKCTRPDIAYVVGPDIAYVVGMLSRYTLNPDIEYWDVISKLLRYLKGTINLICHIVTLTEFLIIQMI
jgi:hypothetical protein